MICVLTLFLRLRGGRKTWIDVAKGILILSVIFFHEARQGLSEVNLDSNVLRNATKLECLYVPFFMAAFFIISGYCSSFEKEFRSFFVSNFKGLILQSVSIVAFIGILLFAVTWDLESFRLGWFTSLRSGGLFWFVLTLFCCKVLFWIQKK